MNLNWKIDGRICYCEGIGCERKGLHAAICGSIEGYVEVDYLFFFRKFAKIDGTVCAGGGEGGWIFGDDDGVDW